ncbi:unnamed protein product [Symbiodinium necroappetens]|uniref:Uncharacterized protein n=1 Tax=Symbiodinium necroappetens TaxID=1628268 RepID=A0A812W2A5_9DINO|nr:unnamed protein product [Symbiodinium necroappetens]
MLRRPATCDIEDMTRKLRSEVETQPGSDGTVVHMQVDNEPAAETPKESVPAGVPAETSTKESVPAGVPVETSTKESVPAGAEETSTEESVPTGAVETTKESVPAGGVETTKESEPAGAVETTKESVPAGAVETSTKESVPAGVPAETSTKESVPAGVPVETSTKESVPAGAEETSTKESVPAGVKVETCAPAGAVQPLKAVKKEPGVKPDRQNESEEDRRTREAHNSYMRYYRSLRSPNCPPEVRAKALLPNGQKRSTSVMHGVAIADDIRASKKAMDPSGQGRWWKVHPDQPKNEDWELYKCFDSREEVSESEDELQFGVHADVGLDHEGTAGVLWLAFTWDLNLSAALPNPNNATNHLQNPKPKRTAKAKSAKPAPQEAVDLLAKGTQRIIEADGMENMLRTGGMGDAFAKAMVADMQSDINKMKQHHARLQQAATDKVGDKEMEKLNEQLKASYAVYDEKMKSVKRALRPAPKAKAKGKAQAKAAA